MALKNDHYTYRVTWSEDDNEYVGLCVEFPILSWLAKTPEAALKGIRKIVADVVVDMQKNRNSYHNTSYYLVKRCGFTTGKRKKWDRITKQQEAEKPESFFFLLVLGWW
jgi:predicted RNase H-like HicB family nuclease